MTKSTRDRSPHPRAGQVYEFNKVMARVIGCTNEDVSWQEDGKKAVHQTPRFNECQKEIWASLANEKADDLRVLRNALAKPA